VREPIKDYARIGIVHSMAYPQVAKGERGFLETLREIVEDDYFSAVELGAVTTNEDREKAAELLAESGFAGRAGTVAYAAQGLLLGRKLDLGAQDSSERDEAIDAIREGIDEASALGASSCGILAGKDPGDRFKRETAKARLVESIERVCHYAAEKAIVVELEQFDRVPFGKNSLIGPTEEGVEVAQEVRRHHENFGLLVDLSHLPLLNEHPRRAVNAAGELLVHAHIGNCVKRDPHHPAYGDEHPVFGIPEGENDVPEIREFLAGLMDIAFLKAGGQRMLSFEVKPFGNQTTEEVIAICKAKLDEAWRRL
jgi:sugar phosphate isomerase/epimerase